ncbi:hypothetical protein B0H19DRAFT_1085964 [Mycena capillaripes]|nr:hypothetical protein B0H19DRAFT_1085964 [Mycena capillaripes]
MRKAPTVIFYGIRSNDAEKHRSTVEKAAISLRTGFVPFVQILWAITWHPPRRRARRVEGAPGRGEGGACCVCQGGQGGAEAEKELEKARLKFIAAILKKRDAHFPDADAARRAEEPEVEKGEAEANSLKLGEAEGDKLSSGLLEWIGNFIWGSKRLAPEEKGST